MLANDKLQDNRKALASDSGTTITFGSGIGSTSEGNDYPKFQRKLGNDIGGYIDVMTGASPSAGNIWNVAFATAYASDFLIVKIIPMNAVAGAVNVNVWTVYGSHFEVGCDSALEAATNYIWAYEVTEMTVGAVDTTIINTQKVHTSDIEPTTTDIPDGQCAVWYNTTDQTVRYWINIGGKLGIVTYNFPSNTIDELKGGTTVNGEPAKKPSAGA